MDSASKHKLTKDMKSLRPEVKVQQAKSPFLWCYFDVFCVELFQV